MLSDIFGISKPVIAMIHLWALPGTPVSQHSLAEIEAQVRREATIYREGGVHGIMIENMHDVPYLAGDVGPEIVAAMTRLGMAAREASGLPCGVQVLAGANRAALAVAQAAELDWIRVEGYAFAHIADEGFINSSAAELLRFRRMIGADHIRVWADIKKKHSAHAITADVTLGEVARAVAFMRGDALIVTGSETGAAPRATDLSDAKNETTLPVLLGSGMTTDNLQNYIRAADGFIVGSYFKAAGLWSESPDPDRIAAFMDKWADLTAG